MYFLLLLTFLLTHHLSFAIPAAPIAQNPPNDLNLILDSGPRYANLNRTMWTLVDGKKRYRFPAPARLSASRPHRTAKWPEGEAGNHFLILKDFGSDIRLEAGQSILAKAAQDVQGWIQNTGQHQSTPVRQEHVWRRNAIELRITPGGLGPFLLGDLQAFIALIRSFHAHYQGYWEWEAQLVVKEAQGRVGQVGTAKLWKY